MCAFRLVGAFSGKSIVHTVRAHSKHCLVEHQLEKWNTREETIAAASGERSVGGRHDDKVCTWNGFWYEYMFYKCEFSCPHISLLCGWGLTEYGEKLVVRLGHYRYNIKRVIRLLEQTMIGCCWYCCIAVSQKSKGKLN